MEEDPASLDRTVDNGRMEIAHSYMITIASEATQILLVVVASEAEVAAEETEIEIIIILTIILEVVSEAEADEAEEEMEAILPMYPTIIIRGEALEAEEAGDKTATNNRGEEEVTIKVEINIINKINQIRKTTLRKHFVNFSNWDNAKTKTVKDPTNL